MVSGNYPFPGYMPPEEADDKISQWLRAQFSINDEDAALFFLFNLEGDSSTAMNTCWLLGKGFCEHTMPDALSAFTMRFMKDAVKSWCNVDPAISVETSVAGINFAAMYLAATQDLNINAELADPAKCAIVAVVFPSDGPVRMHRHMPAENPISFKLHTPELLARCLALIHSRNIQFVKHTPGPLGTDLDGEGVPVWVHCGLAMATNWQKIINGPHVQQEAARKRGDPTQQDRQPDLDGDFHLGLAGGGEN